MVFISTPNYASAYAQQTSFPPSIGPFNPDEQAPKLTNQNENLLLQLDPYKSMGPDEIHPRILKELPHVITKSLSMVFEWSWESREIPVDWKVINIVLIFMKGKKEDPRNYRPVNLTSVPSKIMANGVIIAVSCMGPGVGLNDPDGSLPTQHSLRFYNLFPLDLPKIVHNFGEVRLPQCRAEWDNPLPQIPGDALPDAPRTQLALLAARALLTNIQLTIDQDPQVPFHSTAFQHLIPQSLRISRVASSQVQNLALSFVELHIAGDCQVLSFLKATDSNYI
ncbi:hypothetical protein WISP_52371 [Willisornis vidua]|uniref:Uncharacterized protein n=1 Tax=Willisornis vidua TaxID=1566151 RepID=A0ABQ9DJE2_9PASS|nr:hypothetical protein WISP_52371 [Willisornis vidua]